MASKYLTSILQVAIGIVLVFISPTVGAGLIISGVFSAAAIALTPDRTEASDETQSPTYGFAQFRNPVKGDSPIPVIYSANGHKTAPVWLRAFVTPKGFGEDDDRGGSPSQRLSGLLAVAEGPIVGIEDLRFNDQPVFEKIEGYVVGVGNGSKKKWRLPQSRIDMDSLEVAVDGTVKGYLPTRTAERLGTGDGSQTTWSFDLPEGIIDEIPVKFYSINPSEREATSFDLSVWELTGFQTWMVTKNRLVVHRDEPLVNGTPLYISYGQRVTNGVSFNKRNGSVRIKFDVAPANGEEITATFLRKRIRGLTVDVRLGGTHQLPIWGFHFVRNSFGVQQSMPQGVNVEKDTRDEVDDVVINLASDVSGFGRYDDEGKLHVAKAQFVIEVKRQTALGNGNTFDDWYRVPDPRGRNRDRNKAAMEFQILGQLASQIFRSYSVRNLLDELVEQNPGNSRKAQEVQKARSDFVRGRYTVRVRRTNPVASLTNTSWFDDIEFSSITEVRDEMLNLPGTALIGFHALGTKHLSGSAPNVTCVVKGKRNVRKIITPSNVHTLTTDPDAQSNRVYAAIDLLTNTKYGAGQHYSDADIDLESALECAQFQEEIVRKGKGATDTEQRSRLDIVLDTRKSLMDHLREILTPGRVWAVLRGNTWHFVKDDAVDLSSVPVLYDDTKEGRTAKNTLGFTHEPVVTIPTEVHVEFLNEDENWQSKPVWIVPEEPGIAPRRIRRVTATGTTRETEAARYGLDVYYKLHYQGTSLTVGAAPGALDFTAGDVIRVVSNRVGIDGYWRIWEMSMGTDSFFTEITGRQYLPSNYGQQVDKQTIIRDGLTRLLAAPPPTIRAPAAGAETVTKAPPSGTQRGSRRMRERRRVRQTVRGRARRVA